MKTTINKDFNKGVASLLFGGLLLITLSGCGEAVVSITDVNQYNDAVQAEIVGSDKLSADEKTTITGDLTTLKTTVNDRDIEKFIETKENMKATLINTSGSASETSSADNSTASEVNK